MYLDYYKLKKEPFGITPDPEFLFLSPSHKEALASIIYGVRMRKGFVAVTGEVGVGKTTIIRSYLERTDSQQVKVIYLFNSDISFSTLLRTIILELGQAVESDKTSGMIDQLHRELIEQYRKGINVVLIIDEAQNMPVGTLENLRMLSNLETTKEKLIQVIFSGQTEFDRMLERTELRQLKQRIAVKVTIRRLTMQESKAYIKHRLSTASAKYTPAFTSAATSLLVKKAGGIPRTINILCGNGLITAFGHQKKKADYWVAREIISDMDGGQRPSMVVVFGSALLVLLLSTGAIQVLRGNVSAFSSMMAGRMQKESGVILPEAEAVKAVAVRDAGQESSVETADVPAQEEMPAPVFQPSLEEKEVNQADPAPRTVVTKVVGKGDTLSGLIMEVYGSSNDELIEQVANNNPGIKDVNVIFVGESIAFPGR